MTGRRKVILYSITHVVSGKIYIGITSRALRKRLTDHWSSVKGGSSTRLAHAMRKYGRDAFTVCEIGAADTWDEAKELEQQTIARLGTMDERFGYNLTAGGDGTLGWVPSAETRAKISDSNREFMSDPERRAHLSRLAKIQLSDPLMRQRMYASRRGKPLSDEHRRKISASGKLRPPRSQETRDKLRAALIGKKRPAEFRLKMSIIKKGRKMSPEFSAKMSAIQKGKPKSEAARAAMKAAWVQRRERQQCGA